MAQFIACSEAEVTTKHQQKYTNDPVNIENVFTLKKDTSLTTLILEFTSTGGHRAVWHYSGVEIRDNDYKSITQDATLLTQ